MKRDTTDLFEVFPWNDNFATQIPVIDEQHKRLVCLLNKLASHLVQWSDVSELKSLFAELIDYADYHFKTEEAIWQEYFADDSWYVSHLQTHRSFADTISELEESIKHKDQNEGIHDLVRFLTHWLTFHILDKDRRMALTILAIDSGLPFDKAKSQADEKMSASFDVLLDTVLLMYDRLSSNTMELIREKNARRRAEEAMLINEQRWQFVMESAGDEIWDWDIVNGEIDRSGSNLPLFDLLSNQQLSSGRLSRIHPEDLEPLKNDLRRHLDGDSEIFVNKHRVVNVDRTCYWVLTRGKVISRDEKGKALRMVGTHVNITEREVANLLFQNSSEGMMVTDVKNRIITVNPAFTEITGYSLFDVVGKTPSILRSNRHSGEFFRTMWEDIEQHGRWHGEIWNRKKDGAVYPAWLTINNVYHPDRSVHYRIGLFFDISDKKASEEAVWRQANFDALTGLPNRQMFYDRFLMELKSAHRERRKLALLFIDLDQFKLVNDTLGHSHGDILLVDVARRLKSCVRESDTVARLSGDEFTILLKSINSPDVAERIASNILKKMQQPFIIGEDVLHVSVSIGITICPDDATDREDLLRNADQAMYQAKKNGRNCLVFFTHKMQEAAQHRITMANDLKAALASQQFELVYQPIVELASGQVHKAEALIRWRHPSRGIISPNDFIGIAEDSGIIHEIGNWVFFSCVRQMMAWKASYGRNMQISINKSSLQFNEHHQTQHCWLTYLREQNVARDSLIIEITESLLLDSGDTVRRQLEEYARAGVQIALDDFGTGFSSLAYLQQFDIDFIKIDKSFVNDLIDGSKSHALCKAMVKMAHALGIKVIAEGIESEQQWELLRSFDCDYGQGFYYSPPVAAEQFERFLELDDVFNNAREFFRHSQFGEPE